MKILPKTILPKAFGTRPRLAVEIRWGGVVAARAESESAASAGLVAAVSRAELGPEALEPGLKPGNFRTRSAVIAAVRKTLEAVHEKGMERQVTVVVPDAAVRVLLLDFDTLPAKAAEALPVVRFRLKKLLPFDADDAQVSYQLMPGKTSAASGAGGKALVRVVAVAIPRAVLEEYEAVVREAGFEPGAVLPSTLAALSGLEDTAAAPALVVNAGPQSVTTAIVENGVLLLHRSVDMSGNVGVGILAEAGASQTGAEEPAQPIALPLVDREASQQEWAMQQPEPQYGRDPYGDAYEHEAGGHEAGAANLAPYGGGLAAVIAAEAAAEARREAGGASFAGSGTTEMTLGNGATGLVYGHAHGPVGEVTQAVSVAAAYFEDTLQQSPATVLSAGSTSAEALGAMLAQAGFGVVMDGGADSSAVRVMEMVRPEALVAQAASVRVPRSWLAGVRGALRS
jgi:type IV pilus assembly protein PilM